MAEWFEPIEGSLYVYKEIEKTNYFQVVSTSVGQKILGFMGIIERVSFYIKKAGSPSGTCYMRIKRVSDGTVLAEVSKDVTTLTFDSWNHFDLSSPLVINSPTDIYILFEYSEGNEFNNLLISIVTADIYPNENLVVNGVDHTDKELSYKLWKRRKITWIPKLSGWSFIKPIKITERSGNNLSDYQVLIELNSSNFDFSKAKSDGSDIRFLLPSGKSIPYWIESWDKSGQNAKVWVKVPSIPANSSTVIYMYYGNPSASSESNGDNVFEFFDDFSTNTIGSKWNKQGSSSGSVSISGGYLILDPDQSTGGCEGTAEVISTQGFDLTGDNSFLLKGRIYISDRGYWKVQVFGWYDTSSSYCVAGTDCGGSTKGAYLTTRSNADSNNFMVSDGSGSTCLNYNSALDRWVEIEIARLSNGHYKTWEDGNYIGEVSTHLYSSSDARIKLAYQGSGAEIMKADYVFVRKYTSPEPTFTVGPEIWL